MSRGVSRRAFLRRASVAAGGLAVAGRFGRLGSGTSGANAWLASPWPAHVQPAPVEPLMHGAPSAPPIITRAEWGADESLRRGAPAFSPPRKLVLHHTAVNSTGDFPADVREVFRLHMTRDGATWEDVGYHFLIDPNGQVYEGRWAREYADGEPHDGHDVFGRIVRGSHAMGFNTGTLAIAIMGDFSGARPPDPMLASLVDVLAWLCAHHALDPLGVEPFVDANGAGRDVGNIMGHRDVRETACPGQVTYDLIPELRQRVADRLAASASATSGGYRVLAADGRIASRGSAADLGDPARARMAGAFVAVAGTPAGDGLWTADAHGGVFTVGSAGYRGSVPELENAGLSGPVDATHLARSPSGGGYWILDRNGGVFAFGDAGYHGSVPERRNQDASVPPIDAVSLAPTPSGGGYWVLDRNGGVFTFGDAPYFGSLPELARLGVDTGGMPAVDLAASPSGRGYWVLDRRGGVFAFGDAGFHGSVPQTGFRGAPACRMQPTPDGSGYLVLCDDGAVLRFGGAGFAGHGPRLPTVDLVTV